MSSAIRILLVDDHQMLREGIRDRLAKDPRFKVVGEAANAEEAIKLMPQASPAIVVLDIKMPGASGIDLAKRLRRDWPDVRILVLSGYDFDQYIRALARIGIHGYLLKDAPRETVVEALDVIAQGGVVLPPRIASKVMRSYASEPAGGDRQQGWNLTLREVDILESLHEGLRNADIAERLEISTRTVESHVSSILAKLGARSRMEAVIRALEAGVIR